MKREGIIDQRDLVYTYILRQGGLMLCALVILWKCIMYLQKLTKCQFSDFSYNNIYSYGLFKKNTHLIWVCVGC